MPEPSSDLTKWPLRRQSIVAFFHTALEGPLADQLQKAQRETILDRTNILVWIAVFGMPTTCLLYVYFLARSRLELASWFVLAAVVAALGIRFLISRHVFDRYYHLSMLVLVGGVFGPLASGIIEITRGSTGDFFFSFFMIFFSFTALYPAETKWIFLTSCTVIGSFLLSHAWRPATAVLDGSTTSGIIYLLELTFMGTVMNRVVYRLFFDEKRARFELAVANDGLRELDRAKSSFFSNISHEIRTPLTLILAPLALILESDQSALPRNVREKLEGVRANALRLLRMVNSLLDFAKLEGGLETVQVSDVNVDDLVTHVTALFAAAAERKGLSLVVRPHTGGLVVMSDTDKVEKVLVNLLGNAVKFTPAGGTVTVECTRKDASFVLRVSDTGPGIPAEHQTAIFERFTQLESSHASVRGTGIGLSMVQEYARLLGGRITLESEVGKGSSFSVELPIRQVRERIATTGPETPSRLTPAAYAGTEEQLAVADLAPEVHLGTRQVDTAGPGHPRVLIVDDNPALVNLVSSILEPDYNLFLASNGGEALERLSTDAVDLVVSDVMMPGVTGLELVKRIRADERIRLTPIILLTARGASTQRVEGLEVGADDYLGKPFDPNELRARVRSLFELRRTSQALAVKSEGLERALVRLKAEELKVIESEKLRTLGELAAGIFHELHNHLNIICNGAVPLADGLTDLATNLARENGGLRDDVKEELASTRELASHVLAAAQAARGVTAELKGYAYQDNQTSTSDLNSIIESTVRIFGTLRGGGEVKLSLAPGPVPVHCTSTRLQQVFTNLIKNAIEAMNGSGEVTIETAIKGQLALATVTDNGPGIALSNRSNIFEPFFTTKKQGEGLGLGLSLSRKVLHDLGGDLRYDTEHVGGARFVLTLPLDEGPEHRLASPTRDAALSPQA